MRRPTTTLIAALLLSAGMVGFFFGLWIPASHRGMLRAGLAGGYGYGNDFYQIWLTSRELLKHRADAYSADMQREIEIGLYGRPLDRRLAGDATTPFRGDCYPLHASVLALPLAGLSFPGVQIVLSVLLPMGVMATVLLWCSALQVRASGGDLTALVLLTLTSVPVLEGFYALQTSLVVALLIAGAMVLLRRGWLFAAGTLLAVATVKPQLILLLMAWLTAWAVARWKERRRFLLGFVGTAFVLLAITTWALPSWFAGWMHSVHEYRRICPPPLAEFMLGREVGIVVSLLLVMLAAIVCARVVGAEADAEAFLVASVLVLAITVVVLPSTIAVYDQFLLFPAAIWLYTRREVLRRGLPLRLLGGVTAAALAWPWFGACALLILALISPAGVHQPGVLLVPLRTAASVPFGLVALISFAAVMRVIRERSGYGRSSDLTSSGERRS
jgi:hypothetical protein